MFRRLWRGRRARGGCSRRGDRCRASWVEVDWGWAFGGGSAGSGGESGRGRVIPGVHVTKLDENGGEEDAYGGAER